MKRFRLAALLVPFLVAPVPGADSLGKVLDGENQTLGVTQQALPAVDDLAYLRRLTIDLIGRIPTTEEIQEFESLPAATRRQKAVERLLADERFADRWTVFFADMLRLRTNAEGGAASVAFINRALREGMGWDEMARRMIAASGKSGATPELGFILGDNADPMALAGATAQVIDDDLRPFAGQRQGVRPADSASRAGHYRHASFESIAHEESLRRCTGRP